MGVCVGYIGWRAPIVLRKESAVESVEEAQEVIWPKPFKRQLLTLGGTRGDRDPALLTCHGSCSKSHTKWTWHRFLSSAGYKCNDCGNTRKWGGQLVF